MDEAEPSPWFPCWRLAFHASVDSAKEIAMHLNEVVDDGCWCLLGPGAVASERQMWAAWAGVRDNQMNGAMKARSVEVEYIRILAGTHNIDQAFNRVGLQEGDVEAWLAFIPDSASIEGDDQILPPLDWKELQYEAARLANSISSDILARRPSIDLLDGERMGLDTTSMITEMTLLAGISNSDSTS
ncbi:MAG: EKC/KEOPS complex subunit CGI121/TPRKB [Candidatus Poseidoniaceae archaeon]|jgi:hypothetical protein|nr:EKC/KEOPS complex subunit CGI121/TPRKB [Candidatus Poseidoniaceae archaeon]